MTAERVLVYARGGGHGHAMRGAVVQRLLEDAGHDVTLLVTEASARWLGACPRTYDDAVVHRERFDTIVVDTFPTGWLDELDAETLTRFARRVLVARYNRDPAYSTAGFHRVLSPYPSTHDEWAAPLLGAEHTGWLVRPAPMRIDPEGEDLVVLDPGARLPASLLERMAAFARRVGLRLVHLLRAPEHVRARKLLCVGAGYHTVYELASTAADLRFVPLARRHDDQANRAARVGRSAPTLQAVVDWLRAPADTSPIHTQTAPPSLGDLT